MAKLAGISKRTLERIETNPDGSVTLWHLVNLALVLECDLYDLIEDEWLAYRQVNVEVAAPAQTALGRPEGSREPRQRRERARRRTSTS